MEPCRIRDHSKMKKFTFKGVLDGIRGSVSQQSKAESEIEETLRTEHFQVAKTVRHGFPYQPTAMAFDPVQRILAIGTKSGSLRILGRPGVDCHVRHEADNAILQLLFLVNEGALVSVCSDDTLHLWNLRQKIPEIVHTLKFQRERITYCHLPFQSKWLYIGTERGNVHIVNIESFVLSGYVINWNKAIELSRKTHPGAVVHLSDNPADSNKLLIGFESGTLVLWDLRNKAAELRYQNTEALRSVSWHHEGKQFMCSHADGSLSTWNLRVPLKAATTYYPHGKTNKDGKQEPCKAITKLEWKSQRAGDTFVVFSGGLPHDRAGVAPSITVIHGKTTTVLEMEHSVVDFITLCESPWQSEPQEPYAIVVLLHNDLVVVDLTTPGYLCFENPYPMDLHESSVTCCMYLADCPADLIPALYSMGARANKRAGFSDKEWPIKGGAWGTNTCSYPEMIITGHADGSLKFWDASALSLQILYKLKTAKIFEKPQARSLDGQQDDDPFAIQQIFLCPESRMLCVAGASSQVILFRFSKQESTADIPALEIPIICENDEEVDYSPEYEYPPRPTLGGASQQGSYAGSCEDRKVSSFEVQLPLKVKSGPQKRSPGYQASLVCLTHCVEGEPPGQITSLALNSSYGLMAYGNEVGLVIIDICQKTCLLNIGSPDLYGSSDPYQRIPRSPKKNQVEGGSVDAIERCRSPTSDQSLDPFPSPPPSPRHMGTKFCLRKSISVDPTSFAHPDCVDHPCCNASATDAPTAPVDSSNQRRVSLLPSTRVQRSNTVPSEFQSPGNNNGNHVLLEHVMGLKESQFLSSSSSASSAAGEAFAEEVLADSVFEPESVIKLKSKFKQNRSLSWRGFGFSKRKSAAANKHVAQRHTVHMGDSNNTNGPSVSENAEKSRGWRRRMSVVDLRGDSEEASPLSPVTTVMKRLIIGKEKIDTSFSRSRSSSISSLENITNEAIQCLVFTDSYTRKSDTLTCPTLWVGTSLGSVLVIMLNSPAMGSEARQTQPVIVSPSGTIFRLKGAIMSLAFLDCNGALLRYQYETWRDLNRLESREGKDRERASTATTNTTTSSITTITPNQLLPGTPLKSPHNPTNRISPTAPAEMQAGDRQFVVIASEKQARVIALPSQTCAFKQQLADASSFVVKADVISMKDSVCLACYGANGHLATFTLPSLRPLMDIDFLPLIDLSYQTSEQGTIDPMICIWGKQLIHSCETDLIARTFCFSNYGHGMFLCSPCEIQKFAISTEFCSNLTEMLGELFLACDTPEAPKESFFKNLFGGGPRALDREELFGEASGKASRSIARHIPGSVNMDNLNTRVTGVVGDVSRARQALNERGEGLSVLEDRTQRMLTEAEVFHQNTHHLMMKYRDKKWYQF